MGSAAPPPKQIPPMLYEPGKKPALTVALGRARWSAAGSRVVLLVGSSGETPAEQLLINANGEPFSPDGTIIVVDPNDRFSIGDLSSRAQWTVTVAARANDKRPASPVLIVAQGDDVLLDGKPMAEGYGALYPGKHRLTNASSAWLTVPTIRSLDVADLDVSVGP
jgi:hypothetical protein